MKQESSLAQYVVRALKGSVVLFNENEGVVYDERTALWVHRSAAYIANVVGKTLTREYNLLYYIWKKHYHFETEPSYNKKINETWMYLGRSSTHKAVFKQCINMLTDKNGVIDDFDYKRTVFHSWVKKSLS